MKRYEKMSKEEIIGFLEKARDCDSCPLSNEERNGNGYCEESGFKDCAKASFSFLTQKIDIKKVPRITTIRTKEELSEARKQFVKICRNQMFPGGCQGCPYLSDTGYCFDSFLLEEIEVEDNDK